MSCIPGSLYVYLTIGRQSLFHYDIDSDESSEQGIKSKVQNIISRSLDLLYGITDGKNWTPKHINLASKLYQTTRIQEFIQIFHNASHIISYEKVNNSLVEGTLKYMNMSNGPVVPPNLVSNTFIHFTCDNIDFNVVALMEKKLSCDAGQLGSMAQHWITEPNYNTIERK